MAHHNYYVYITTNPDKTVIYTGITNDLKRRMCEHYLNRGNKISFVGKYYCYNLVYFEYFTYVREAIQREKEIKNMKRETKIQLIAEANPRWRTLRID